ncbi:MAG: peptidoglycan DD-metalloendopeptidase family protein [Candidatus Sumerlaeaceae bacterium]|nr:peptidoglycan DD-metalloendopeptidase family protein [Candidatus Sumerlaeaceae bacterium]
MGGTLLFLAFRSVLQVQSKAEPPDLRVRIIGTASFQDRAVALVEDLNSQIQAFYRVGDVLYGYRIVAIEPTRVLLERDGQSYVVAYEPLTFRSPEPESTANPPPRPTFYVDIVPRRTTPSFYGPGPSAARWDSWSAPPSAPPTAIRTDLGGRFAFPVASYKRLSSPFGYRRHPIRGGVRKHTGIDLASWTGTKIFAADSGTVIHSGWLGGYGYCVMIDHHNGYVTVYGHCSKLVVDVGDNVRRGDYIAQVGSTGASTGPHLHFEIRRNGTPIDPALFFRGRF